MDVRLRPEFQKFAGKIYLPRFVYTDGNEARSLSYEMDILSRIDWSQVDIISLSSMPSFFSQHVQQRE